MIDLEQLKIDRKAGTAGTWKWERNRYGYCVELAPSVIEPEEQLDLSDADARRIARLPELEAAYIEVVAKLDKAVEALGDIKNPIAYLEREAEKSGAEGLNSNAVILAKDYAFLQLLATNALAAIKGSSHD